MNYPTGTVLGPSGIPVQSSAASPGYASYAGSSTEDRLADFGFSGAGPTAALISIPAIRRRARALERNNPLAMKAINSFVSNLVGTDISPSWDGIENDEQREEIQELWEDSRLEADYYGTTDFYGTVEQACRSMVRDGEQLGRFHHVDPAEGLLVPLQVQGLESDHLDVGYNDISPEGNEIRYSIEWKNGRRYRYWLHREHPGEMFLTGTNLERVAVPAADIAHVFRPLRAGQARGIAFG